MIFRFFVTRGECLVHISAPLTLGFHGDREVPSVRRLCQQKGTKCPVKQVIPGREGSAREYRSGTQGSMAVDGCGGVQNILGVRNSRKKRRKKIHGFHELAVETCALDIPMNLWG